MHWVKYIRRESVVAVLFKSEDDFEVAESAFRAAILWKIAISVRTSCGSQTCCTSDRLTPGFCCDSPSLKMIVVYSAHSKKA